MLKQARIAQLLWRIEYFSSDASPMQLASVSRITKLLSYGFKDVGNCAVTVVSLAFSRLSLMQPIIESATGSIVVLTLRVNSCGSLHYTPQEVL